ncbi:Low temperature viability protein [Ascodesmis nigricans]|uniref:Low temperature viability protein n=1 Tax=Ascodesmis nigricans TaxID=341454 RepID=A0A4S2N3W6_9PEZI|nr:Low temperature viability protein [Ascodesmis nigricans]
MAPPKKWIDKKSAQNFQLRYRSQNDPLIHDSSAADFVFAPVEAPNASKKGKTKNDLEGELDVSTIRPNEGEAANYGIYFDDSKYDYMQHLRDIGEGGNGVDAVFIEAKQSKQKGKKKMTLEEALIAEDEQKKKNDLLMPKELLPSEKLVKRTWQDQMDIPASLQGFQPDMDPRLREVLEALEDDAYVEEDEDLFGELAQGGEVDEDDFEDMFFDEEDEDGYASDATEKAPQQPSQTPVAGEEKNQESKTEPAGSEDWMKEYSKFAKDRKKSKKVDDDMSSMADTMSFGGLSSVGSTMSVSKRRRRREKSGTATSGYSMTSSSLFRTEGLTLLDDRFDKIEEMYNEDSEEEDRPDGPLPETRKDFDRILDEFLGQYNVVGSTPARARVKRGAQLTGMEQLDEIRKGLGKARIR